MVTVHTGRRRDRAFSIFYMGVNLGAFAAPMVVGTIGDPSVLGYKAGFSFAGFGMVAGLITYCSMGRYLPPPEKARKAIVGPGAAVTAFRRGGAMQHWRVSVNRAWRLGTWDAVILPKPGARIQIELIDYSGDPDELLSALEDEAGLVMGNELIVDKSRKLG